MSGSSTYGALIDGKWLPPAETGGERLSVRAPWDGALLGEVALASSAIVERAVASAASIFRDLQTSPEPLHRRIEVLERAAWRLADRETALAEGISAEAGKPISLATAEVQRAAATFRDAAIAARSALDGEVLSLDTTPGSTDRVGITRRFPLGPVSAITPFNFPLNLVAHKVAPAIAAGCPVLLKPAPQAPLTAFRLAEICLEAGLEPRFLQVLCCDVERAAPLVEDGRIAVLSFTGSARVGWSLKTRAGRKRVVLELGGNGAVIVEECEDLTAVARRVASAANAYAGQTCISVQRVLVKRTLESDLRDALIPATRDLRVGDPAEPATVVGPVIDDGAASRIESWVASARERGARCHDPLERSDRLLHPVVLEGVPPDHELIREEVFGPVTTLEPYDDLAEAIGRLNASRYGLQAGIYVRDVGKLLYAFEHLQVGAVLHDDCPTFRVDAMPYGGTKESGMGREGPRYAIEEMTEPRLLLLRRNGNGDRP